MNYSICSISFRHELVSFHDLVRFVCDKSLAGIELWGIHARSLMNRQAHEVPQMLELLNTEGACITMLSDYIEIGARANQLANIERAHSLFALAHFFRTDKIRIFAGSEPSAYTSLRCWEESITQLRELAQIASDYGVYLVIETHPNTLADNLSSTLSLLHEVAHSHIRINLDFLHIWESDSEPIDAYYQLKSWTVNYHLKNISSRSKLALLAPQNVYSPSGDRNGLVHLSKGAVDYSSIINLLTVEQTIYPATLEWFGDQPFRYLEQELTWLRKHELSNDAAIKI